MDKLQDHIRTRLRSIWGGMKYRCFNSSGKHWHRYGGRGITICAEWMDFDCFYLWCKSNGYQDWLTIDRRNNNGNYEPDNCRFVTHAVNSQNSSNAKLTYDEVREIRLDIRKYGSASASKYNVSKTALHAIGTGRTWSDFEPENIPNPLPD